jgi:aryl-alcohol dehydrogenase-like predicted oxidoreductase
VRYIKLGNSGLEVSPIAIGAMTYGEPERGHPVWSLGEEDSRPLIKHALDAGINFFDTANMYSLGSIVVAAPVVGASKASQIDDAVASVTIHLTDEELLQLQRPYTPRHDFQGISDDAELERIKSQLPGFNPEA